jgi:hypothetical protein
MSQLTMSAADYPVPAVSTMNALNENFTDLLNTGTGVLLPVFQEVGEVFVQRVHRAHGRNRIIRCRHRQLAHQ